VAWDTEGTRRRLLDAATAEFAEHGRDGTTLTQIATRAGVNKERLYAYFGDKQTLWDLVLTTQLERLADAVEVSGVGLDDIGAFAGATFDFHDGNPHLARLLQWEGLQSGPPAAAGTRRARYREKVARFAAAQAQGTLDDSLDADHLVFAVIALAAWWQTVPQLAEMITATSGRTAAERRRRRAFVVAAARRLAAPEPGRDIDPG
jgi:AcrR family transcriptional regulator